jgi:hypothetical protein
VEQPTPDPTLAAVHRCWGGEAAYLAWRRETLDSFPPATPELRADLVTLLTQDEDAP